MRESFATGLISKFLNALYPSNCPGCGTLSDIWKYAPLCSSCWHTITPYKGPSCSICATPLASREAHVCLECLREKPPFARMIVFGIYEGAFAESIRQFKFSEIRRFAVPLGELLLTLGIPPADGIIAVPLTRSGLKQRGFNQSLLIANVVSRERQIPLYRDILVKQRETPAQLGLSARERRTNLRNAFAVTGSLEGLSLLLVDDVITTGATAAECSRVLLDAGASEVTVLALARTSVI